MYESNVFARLLKKKLVLKKARKREIRNQRRIHKSRISELGKTFEYAPMKKSK